VTCGYKAIAPAGANRSMFSGCYCEEGSGDNWDVAAPAVIISPKGVMPDTRAAGKNIMLAPMYGGGWAAGGPMSFVSDLRTYHDFGSATAPASRAFPGGLVIRGQGGDGDLYQFVSSGQQVGGGTSGTSYDLIWFGDARNRPAFPRGMVASLPVHEDNEAARRGGLTDGEVYRTALGALRIVV
jgi:hypothetical protein